jgi:hypothetical protein
MIKSRTIKERKRDRCTASGLTVERGAIENDGVSVKGASQAEKAFNTIVVTVQKVQICQMDSSRLENKQKRAKGRREKKGGVWAKEQA